MEKPKTYLDRLGRKKKEYVFVSYSHADAEHVFALLGTLYEAGVNYWYDAELTDGQVWNEEVRGVLASPECIGALFFLSERSVASNAVHQEIAAANERSAAGGRFDVLPVLVGMSSYQELLAKVVASAPKSIADVAALMQNGDRTSVMDEMSAAERIRAFCERIGASEKDYVEIRDTNFSAVDGNKVYFHELGSYPDRPAGGKAPIRWRLISRKDNLLYFISEYCLDFVEYENAGDPDPAAFGLDGRKEVVSLSLVDEALLAAHADTAGRAIPTDYADFKRTQSFRAFWVKDKDGALRLFNSLNRDTGETANPENDTFTAGIRLLLVLDDDKITSEG